MIHLHWDEILPNALLRIRPTAIKRAGFSPYELVYGGPTTYQEITEKLKRNKRINIEATASGFGENLTDFSTNGSRENCTLLQA